MVDAASNKGLVFTILLLLSHTPYYLLNWNSPHSCDSSRASLAPPAPPPPSPTSSPRTATAAETAALRQRLFLNSPHVPASATLAAPLAEGQPQAWEPRLQALHLLGVPSHWDAARASHVRLIPLLLSRAQDNTMIVMYGNSGTLELMMNAICHWSRLRMRNYVIFSHGAPTLAALRAHPLLHGAPDVAVLDLVDFLGADALRHDFEAYHDFGSPTFRVLSSFKYLAVELFLQLGVHAILQDTDVIPQRDYRPHLLRLACEAVERAAENASAPVAGAPQPGPQRCGQSNFLTLPPGELFALDKAPFLFAQMDNPWGGCCNTGFYLMRSCWFSLFALRHMDVMLAHELGISDQNVLSLFTEQWGAMARERIVMLGWDAFPSGYGWEDTANQHADAVVVHANWLTGMKDKLHKIYNAGLMLWKDGACLLE